VQIIRRSAGPRDRHSLSEETRSTNGAAVLLTQPFFDPETYFAFVDRARAAESGIPIVPRFMAIMDVSQIEEFTTMYAASIPASLRDLLVGDRDTKLTGPRPVPAPCGRPPCTSTRSAGPPTQEILNWCDDGWV
jgi:5,10-methylenetetrahydrofolate reductase